MSGRTLRVIVLAALAMVLAVVVWMQLRPAGTVPAGSPPARRAGRTSASGGAANGETILDVPAVRLAALSTARRDPEPAVRDPFRERVRAVPVPAQVTPLRPLPGLTQPGSGRGDPAVPAGPPPPPPIPLRLIGLIEVGEGGPKVAVLTDGRDVYYGKDGEIIDGRYRIVRIGTETVEMTYVDGRGRETLRLPAVPSRGPDW